MTIKISEIIEKLLSIRDQKKQLSLQEKALGEEQESLEHALMDRLDAEGSKSVSSELGTAVITETELPAADDWDATEEWIYGQRALHLLQRRIASGAYRELVAAGIAVPGLRTITKRSIGLTAK